tara:strand:+ start:1227 stop:1430 length:204 start_codon:yes stop_codon:yes gene_type:complete
MEGFTKMTPEEYRTFINWIEKHGQEMYENKTSYECRWSKENLFYVKLCDESVYTLDDIMLDIQEKIV